MLLSDTRGNRKTEARSIGLGGIKWIEQTLLNVSWNPFAVILDLQNYRLANTLAQGNFFRAAAKFDVTVFANTVGGILDKVNQNLAHLLRVHLDWHLGAGFDRKVDRVFL